MGGGCPGLHVPTCIYHRRQLTSNDISRGNILVIHDRFFSRCFSHQSTVASVAMHWQHITKVLYGPDLDSRQQALGTWGGECGGKSGGGGGAGAE